MNTIQKGILYWILGAGDRPRTDLESAWSLPAINMLITGMTKEGLITIDDGIVNVTEEGVQRLTQKQPDDV